jgi:PRTRC genetic system protein E
MVFRYFTEGIMSLFTDLYALTKSRRFAMIVSSDHSTGLMTISVMPRALNEADGKYCKDLTLTATPEDFDTDFVAAVSDYRCKLAPLLEQAKEASAAIDEATQAAKSSATSKVSGKGAAKSAPPAEKPAADGASVTDKARAYLEASSGDDGQDDELNNDWMKNRQPELF